MCTVKWKQNNKTKRKLKKKKKMSAIQPKRAKIARRGIALMTRIWNRSPTWPKEETATEDCLFVGWKWCCYCFCSRGLITVSFYLTDGIVKLVQFILRHTLDPSIMAIIYFSVFFSVCVFHYRIFSLFLPFIYSFLFLFTVPIIFIWNPDSTQLTWNSILKELMGLIKHVSWLHTEFSEANSRRRYFILSF